MVAVPLLVFFGEIKAQFDYGITAGAFITEAREWHGDGHEYGRIIVPGTPFATFSFFYAERTSHAVDFCASLDYAHKEFHALSGGGGMGFGSSSDIHVKQEMLHLAVGADLHVSRAIAVRIALQAGRAFAGHQSGRDASWGFVGNGQYASTVRTYDREALSGGNGDLRLLLAVRGYLVSRGPWSMVIEPYLSYGLTSMTRNPGPKTTDFGLRLGLARHSARRAASYLVPQGPESGY